MYINNHKRSSDKKVDPSVVQNEKVFSKSQTRRTKTPGVVKQVLHSTTFNLLSIHFSINLSDITDINFRFHTPKIIALIEQWKRRI